MTQKRHEKHWKNIEKHWKKHWKTIPILHVSWTLRPFSGLLSSALQLVWSGHFNHHCRCSRSQNFRCYHCYNIATLHMAVCQNPWNPLFCSHQNSWDLWMFIPLKMVLIGIDHYWSIPTSKNVSELIADQSDVFRDVEIPTAALKQHHPALYSLAKWRKKSLPLHLLRERKVSLNQARQKRESEREQARASATPWTWPWNWRTACEWQASNAIEVHTEKNSTKLGLHSLLSAAEWELHPLLARRFAETKESHSRPLRVASSYHSHHPEISTETSATGKCSETIIIIYIYTSYIIIYIYDYVCMYIRIY